MNNWVRTGRSSTYRVSGADQLPLEPMDLAKDSVGW